MKKLIIIALLISGINTFGQDKSVLNKAKKLNANHQYDASIKLLENYLQSRKDVYTLWLYGETLHAAKKYGKALAAYEKALHLDPNNSVLKYDYALKSADAGKLNQAINLIKPYAKYKSDYQFDAYKKLAKFYYWQGAYDQANTNLQKAKWFKNDNETKQLQTKINQAKSNYVKADFSVFSDDQPLTVLHPNVGINYYVNQNITAGINTDLPMYSFSDEQLTGLVLKPFVSINLFSIATKTTFTLDYEKLPNEESVVGGKIAISKYVMKNLNAEANFEYTPYLHTLSALNQKLMQSHYNFGLIWNDANGIMGKLSFDQFNFSTLNNEYYAASAWVLSPKYSFGILSLRAGLGVNYSDTTTNTFVADDDLATIINYSEDQKIKGHYEPFFSPSQQLVTSAVVSAQSQINDVLSISADGNIGIYATTQNPYLYLDRNEHNEIVIVRDFAQMNYSPVTAKLSIDYLLSNNMALKAHYTFQSTNYYQSHLGGITALYKF